MTNQSNRSFRGDSFGAHPDHAARDAVIQLGGDPDVIERKPRPLPPNGNPGKTREPSPSPGWDEPVPPIPGPVPLDALDDDGVRPDWLDPFLNGELKVEDLADRLAEEIRRIPELMHTTWWQRFLNRLVAVVPDRLLAMAERLADCRRRLKSDKPER